MPSLFLYYVLRGEKRHDRTQKPVPPLGLRPTADPKASCRTQNTGVQGNDEQNGQCRHKYTLIQTSFEMTKSSIGSLEITVDWRRVSWRMANSYKRGNKGINEHIIFKNSARHVFIAACSQLCQMFELVYPRYSCQFFLQPMVSSKFEFRYEHSNSKFSLILFVNNLMIGHSKKNRENCPRKCFWWKEKDTRVKILPWVSANQPSNNWAQVENVLQYTTQDFTVITNKEKK